jgi:hypothetical protein
MHIHMLRFLSCTQDTSADKPFADVDRLPALPYAVDALEPHIDKETMSIHYSKCAVPTCRVLGFW